MRVPPRLLYSPPAHERNCELAADGHLAHTIDIRHDSDDSSSASDSEDAAAAAHAVRHAENAVLTGVAPPAAAQCSATARRVAVSAVRTAVLCASASVVCTHALPSCVSLYSGDANDAPNGMASLVHPTRLSLWYCRRIGCAHGDVLAAVAARARCIHRPRNPDRACVGCSSCLCAGSGGQTPAANTVIWLKMTGS
jgi:hypothetical protein